jgi:hypothetical protein
VTKNHLSAATEIQGKKNTLSLKRTQKFDHPNFKDSLLLKHKRSNEQTIKHYCVVLHILNFNRN